MKRRESDAAAGGASRRQSNATAADLPSARRPSNVGANASAVSSRRNSNIKSESDMDSGSSGSRRRSDAASTRISSRSGKGGPALESLDEKKAAGAPAVREVPRSQILLAGLRSGKSLGALFGDVFSTIKGSFAGAGEGEAAATGADLAAVAALAAAEAEGERPEDGYVRFGDSMGGSRSGQVSPRDTAEAAAAALALALAMETVKEETPEDLSASTHGPRPVVLSTKAPDAPPAVLAALWGAADDDEAVGGHVQQVVA